MEQAVLNPNAKQPKTEVEQMQMLERAIQILVHACHCDKNCGITNCQKVKTIVTHAKNCAKRNECPTCKSILPLCSHHTKNCKDPKCSVLFCAKIQKEAFKRQAPSPVDTKIAAKTDVNVQQASTPQSVILPELIGQLVASSQGNTERNITVFKITENRKRKLNRETGQTFKEKKNELLIMQMKQEAELHEKRKAILDIELKIKIVELKMKLKQAENL